MQKILKEPLFHFLLLGGFFFVLYGFINKDKEDPADYEILIQDADIERLAKAYQQSWKTLPDSGVLIRLLDEDIQSEIFYREALRMNLDHNDEIIRRRLKQKYEFLIKDLVTNQTPSEADLKRYYEANLNQYQSEQKITFTQFYFSPDKRQDSEADASKQWEIVKEKTLSEYDDVKLGDDFHLQSYFSLRDQQAVNQLFGKSFADGLFQYKEIGWTKPIQSGYGFHLVWISAYEEVEQLSFEKVKDRVQQNFKHNQLQIYNDELYQNLKEQYKIKYDLENWKTIGK